MCLLPIIAGTLTESDVTFIPMSYRSMDFSLHPFQLDHILHLLHSKLDNQQLEFVLDNDQNTAFQRMWFDFGMIPRSLEFSIKALIGDGFGNEGFLTVRDPTRVILIGLLRFTTTSCKN